jgi:pimeloyl-ACP methyl ester carboxylesterase
LERRIAIALGIVLALVLVIRSAPTPSPSSIVVGGMGRGPVVMLVHGLGSNANQWLPVARDLARDHRVVLVELPGHELSSITSPFTLEQATLALERAIEEQSPDPVTLVGHSVGGLVALTEALHAPNRVRALVLVETALRPQLSAAERDTFRAMLDRDWEGTLHSVYASFGRDSAQGEALWAQASQVERSTMRAWIPVALTTDLSHDAASLRMPVLAVLAPHSWERGETWEHASHALGYDAIRKIEGERIEDCGHFVMLDQPTALARAIRRMAATPPVEPALASR